MEPNLDDLDLEQLGNLRRRLDAEIFQRVQLYRHSGTTWAVIGEYLGVSTGEAHRRYHLPSYAFPLPPAAPAAED